MAPPCLGAGRQQRPYWSVRTLRTVLLSTASSSAPRRTSCGAEGSMHTIQFPYSLATSTDGGIYQYMIQGQARFRFNGWNATHHSSSATRLRPGGDLYCHPTTDGNYRKRHAGDPVAPGIRFPGYQQLRTGQNGLSSARPGVIFIETACYSQNGLIWITPGAHTFKVVPYPGYSFSQAYVGDYIQSLPVAFQLTFTNGSIFHPIFNAASACVSAPFPRASRFWWMARSSLRRCSLGSLSIRFRIPRPRAVSINSSPPIAFHCTSLSCVWATSTSSPAARIAIAAPTPQTTVIDQVRWVFDHFSTGTGTEQRLPDTEHHQRAGRHPSCLRARHQGRCSDQYHGPQSLRRWPRQLA